MFIHPLIRSPRQLVYCLLGFFAILSCQSQSEPFVARYGNLEIPIGWKGEARALEGEWIALEGIRDYEDFLDNYNETFAIQIPSTGSDFRQKTDRKAVTLFLHVDLPHSVPPFELLSLMTKRIWTAHRVFVNGHLIFENGTVAADPESHKPRVKPILGTFPYTKSFDIVVQISNFTFTNDGMVEAPILGKSESIFYKLYYRKFQDILLMVFVALFCVVNLGIYFANTRDRSPLVYAMLLSIGLFHIPFSAAGDRIILDVFPDLSYFFIVRWEAICLFSFIPLFFVFVHTAFPEELSRRWLAFYGGPKLLLAVASLVYAPWFFYLLQVALLYDLIACYWGYRALVYAVHNQRSNAKLFLFGFGVIGFCILMDFFREFGLLAVPSLALYGMPVMFFSHSIALVLRIRDAYSQIEVLTQNLQAGKEFLEVRVEERTHALRNALDQVKDTNRLKDRFLSIVSHDLRSPLAGVSGTLNLLIQDRGVDLDDQDEILQTAKKSIDNLIFMTSEILNYAKNQGMKILPTYSRTAVYPIWLDTVEKMRGLVLEKELVLQAEGDLLAESWIDPMLQGIVFSNLLSNAIKYTPPQGTICYRAEIHGNFLEVTIQDSGVGIAPGSIENLFHYDLNKSTPGMRGEKGTGFGLPFSKEILDAQNISVRVESQPGKGTAFQLSFQSQGECVLILDDNPGFRSRIGGIMRQIDPDIFIIEKEDGPSALLQLENLPIRLIATDYQMPGMNGLDFAFQAREILKSQNRTRTILGMLTSWSSEEKTRYCELEEKARNMGLDFFISKSLSDFEIQETIRFFWVKAG